MLTCCYCLIVDELVVNVVEGRRRPLDLARCLGALGFCSASGRFRFLRRSISSEVDLGIDVGSTGTLSTAAPSNGLILVIGVLVVARQDRNDVGCRRTSSAPPPRLWRLWGDDPVSEGLAFGGHGGNSDRSNFIRCSAESNRSG
jgi:hypothetical protein